jgi:diaminopimelate epimerase
MALLPFVKVEGLGNDFLVVDLRPGKPAQALADIATRPEIVRALCDRNFGVGGDGVLAILPGDAGDARMRVLNADGSEAEMCGNGLRCVAKLLYDTDPALRRNPLRIDTGAGLRECKLEVKKQRATTVTVEMGVPQLAPRLVPVASDAPRLVRAPLRVGGRDFAFTAVSMGNPHAVIFVDDPAANLRELAATFGPLIETDARFPRRTNVEFAARRGPDSNREIDVVVWERGCGITLACAPAGRHALRHGEERRPERRWPDLRGRGHARARQRRVRGRRGSDGHSSAGPLKAIRRASPARRHCAWAAGA